MRRNIVSVGEQVITGDVGKVYAAGEVNIKDADVVKLNGAGEVKIEYSYVEETKLAGELNAKNSSFGSVRIAGEATMNGTCKVGTLVAIGELNAEDLECKILRNFSEKFSSINSNTSAKVFTFKKNFGFDFNDYNSNYQSKWDINLDLGKNKKRNEEKSSSIKSSGDSEYKGNISAETFENLCEFYLDFNYKFKNILSMKPLHANEVIECEQFYSFNLLDTEGINAEQIFIRPYGDTRIGQIMGSHISIKKDFQMDDKFAEIPISLDVNTILRECTIPVNQIHVDTIEGDYINVDYVNANTISGDRVVIGPKCTVKRVEYKEDVDISEEAKVEELVKL